MQVKILIDLDDVLSHMVEHLLSQYNSEYKDTLDIKDINGWDLSKFVKKECGERINMYFKRQKFFSNPKPREDAQEVIEKLIKLGHEVHIVTSYCAEACFDKHRWIEDNFPFINNRNIIFCNNKNMIEGDVLIDDGLHNLKNFKGDKIVFDKPWNQNADFKAIRVKDWHEIEILFTEKDILWGENA